MLHGARQRIVSYELSDALAKHVLQSAGEGKYLQALVCLRVYVSIRIRVLL